MQTRLPLMPCFHDLHVAVLDRLCMTCPCTSIAHWNRKAVTSPPSLWGNSPRTSYRMRTGLSPMLPDFLIFFRTIFQIPQRFPVEQVRIPGPIHFVFSTTTCTTRVRYPIHLIFRLIIDLWWRGWFIIPTTQESHQRGYAKHRMYPLHALWQFQPEARFNGPMFSTTWKGSKYLGANFCLIPSRSLKHLV
jgi:hypothetical protein